MTDEPRPGVARDAPAAIDYAARAAGRHAKQRRALIWFVGAMLLATVVRFGWKWATQGLDVALEGFEHVALFGIFGGIAALAGWFARR